MSNKIGKWVFSNNNYDFSTYYDCFDTKEEAIKEGRSEFKDGYGCEYHGHFYIGRIYNSFKNHITVFTDTILENIAEGIYEEVGDISTDYLQDITDEQERELDGMIKDVIGEWMDKHELRPNFYQIDNVEAIKVKKE